MLDIVELIKLDPELREFYMEDTPSSRGAVWTKTPTKMYIRFWPQNDRDPSFNAIFRYNQGTERTDVDVHFSRTRANIPLTSRQMRMWDNIRTELALAHVYDWSVWVGMAQQPRENLNQVSRLWDQNHVFFVLRNNSNNLWGDVVSFHYETVSYRGHWKETEQYRDWQMTSRDPVLWDEV